MHTTMDLTREYSDGRPCGGSSYRSARWTSTLPRVIAIFKHKIANVFFDCLFLRSDTKFLGKRRGYGLGEKSEEKHGEIKNTTVKAFSDPQSASTTKMWPIHILLNKLVKAEGHNHEEEDMNLAEQYNFKLSLKDAKINKAVLGRSHFVEVPHIKQLRSWDCGLACVLMVLRTLGINHYDIDDLEELCRTTSIWTVDLAYLLQKLSISFSYFTVTLGANPEFSMETFYKEQLANDMGRVDMLFQGSLEAGIRIECRSIRGEEMVFLILSGKYIVIALVDQYILSRPFTEDVHVPQFYNGPATYTGHYVVICGYDALLDEFEIRDPASSRKHKRISSKCLEEARKSFGTDEDILLVSLEAVGH